jgi:hypothetical protein
MNVKCLPCLPCSEAYQGEGLLRWGLPCGITVIQRGKDATPIVPTLMEWRPDPDFYDVMTFVLCILDFPFLMLYNTSKAYSYKLYNTILSRR